MKKQTNIQTDTNATKHPTHVTAVSVGKYSSDVTIIDIKIAIFRTSNRIDIATFWSKYDLIPILYHSKGTGD